MHFSENFLKNRELGRRFLRNRSRSVGFEAYFENQRM